MIERILGSITGSQAAKDDGQEKGIGSLLVIGLILFVLMGGPKIFQKTEDASGESR